MNNECNIVRDLLPLYTEDMVSADTAKFVKEHLEGCEECRKTYEQMIQPQVQGENKDTKDIITENKEAVAPLVNLKNKLRKQKVQTVLCTALFVVALFVSAFAVLSAPEYFPYEEDLFTITEHADENITITFDKRVTGYKCSSDIHYKWEGASPCYRIEAWSTLWDKWFGEGNEQYVGIEKVTSEDFSVYYVSNNNTEDICIYGEPITSGGVITLPRFTLNYYFVIAAVVAGLLLKIWWLMRKKGGTKVWIERIMFYPVSYCIAHVIVAGLGSGTYSANRDFMLIIFLSIVIYGGILLARSIYRERKEIKALTERN